MKKTNKLVWLWLIALIFCSKAFAQTSIVPGIESGVAFVDGNWATINLQNSYTSPVVVCTPNPANNTIPVVVRVQNAGATSFEVKLQNPAGGAITSDSVHYVVVEEGAWLLPDGRTIEAAKVVSDATTHDAAWYNYLRENYGYQQSYSSAVLLGQVMTANDERWSTFYATGDGRYNTPGNTAAKVGKNVGGDPSNGRSNETLGIIVIDAGNGDIDGVAYEVKRGGKSIKGWDDTAPFNYTLSGFGSTPRVAVASVMGLPYNDGGWPVLYGAAPLSASSINLAIDEDQMTDAERSSGDNNVNYLVFESPFAYAFVAPTGIELVEENVSLEKLQTAQLTAEVTPANAPNAGAIWSSSDESVATVDALGFVTAVSEGTATITVTTEDGSFSDSAIVTVIPPVAGEFYISPNGSDDTGDGSEGNPWKTIAFALTNTVADRGDIINLAAGTFEESERLYIPSGVDLIGAGMDQTIVKVNYFYDLTTVPRSTAKGKDQGFDPAPEEGVIHLNGKDHIFRGIKFDGQSDQTHACFVADTLSNSVFEELHIEDFNYTGIWIQSGYDVVIRNNKLVNNAFGYTVRCSGDIMLFIGENIKIHDNDLIENSGDGAYTMMIMNQKLDAFFGYCDGWPNLGFPPIIRDVEIYNNHMEVEEYGAWANYAAPAIVMNMIGSNMLNWDIHHNWINNHISFISKANQECGGVTLKTGERTGRIHHNVFEMRATDGSYEYRYAIEANSPNIEIDHNFFVGGLYPIAQWEAAKASWWKNHYIHHNIYFNQRRDLPLFSYKDYPENFRVEHNTIIDTTTVGFSEYFRLKEDRRTSTPKQAIIRNNIFMSLNTDNFKENVWKPQHFDNPILSHNLFYRMKPFGENTIELDASTAPESIVKMPANLPYSTNYDDYFNVFKDFFELSENSSAIDAGLEVGHYSRGAAPDLGALESGSGNLNPSVHIIEPFPDYVPLNGDAFKVVIDAEDVDGSLASVVLYNGATQLASFTAPPYEYNITSAAFPGYNFVVVATDNEGASNTSDTLSIEVREKLRINGNTEFIDVHNPAFDTGSAETMDDRRILFQTGNSSKNVTSNYTVTENTVLEFEFKSEEEGLAHRIGVLFADSSTFWFQLFGSDVDGDQTYNNYAGSDYQYFSLNIGEKVTGEITHILLETKASTTTANSYFKNIGIVESAGANGAWLVRDIGSVGKSGYTTESVYKWKLNGAGRANFKNSKADAYHFVYQRVEGDVTLFAKLESLQEIKKWTRGGLMIREDLEADSKMYLNVVSANDGNSVLFRNEKGGGTDRNGAPANKAPVWVKITREGDVIKSYQSEDGLSWGQVGSKNIPMNQVIYIGMMVASDNGNVLTEGVYKNVNLVAGISDNNAPTISITSPVDSINYLPNTSITVSADVADLDGSVAKVELYLGTTKIAESTNAAFSYDLGSGLPDGDHTFTVKAIDNEGAHSTEDVTISVFMPVSGVEINKDALALKVGATDSLYAMVLPAEATNKNVTWSNSNPAIASLDSNGIVTGLDWGETTIKVTTENGGLMDSVIVSVSPAEAAVATVIVNQKQSISDWESLGTYNFRSGLTDYVKVRTNNTDGYVIVDAFKFTKDGVEDVIIDAENAVGVEIDGEWQESKIIQPFLGKSYFHDKNSGKGSKSITFTPVLPVSGEWEVSMKWAFYPNRATNVPVDIYATGDVNPVSTVSITSPSHGQAFVEGKTVTIETDAVEAMKVEFYEGINLLGEATSAPFNFNWENTAGGDYILSAKVTAANGVISTTDAVQFRVLSADNPTATLTVNEKQNGGVWYLLGTYNFSTGNSDFVKVRTDGTNGYVFADGFKFIKAGEADIIVDSEDASGITLEGSWNNSTSISGYIGSAAKHDGNSGKGTKSVTYHPNFPSTGEYAVYMRWPAYPNRASNVPVDILATGDATGSESTAQRKANGGLIIGEELNAVEAFTLYPNPSSEGFFVEWSGQEKAEISIFNTVGSLIHSGRYQSGDKIQLEVPGGLYLIRAQIEGQITERKLLIK